MDKNLEKFILKQNQIQDEMNSISHLMETFEDFENRSIKDFYENKEKFEVFIEYSKKYNSFDYVEYQYYYDIIAETKVKEAVDMMDSFIQSFQEFNFQLNLFVNTYIENVINYEMALEFLDKKDLHLSASEISNMLWEIDEISKKKFIDKKVFEYIWVKNFASTLDNILKSGMELKLSSFYILLTKGKTKVLQDYTKYLFIKQLYFRYAKYSWKPTKADGNIVDIDYQIYAQDFLLWWDINAYLEFVKTFYIIIYQYPLTWNSLIVLRSIFSFFNVFYSWDGKVKNHIIEKLSKQIGWDKEMKNFLNETMQITQEMCNIIYNFTYSKEIENFKSKNDLTDEEFELFKKFRFAGLFLQGNIILDIYDEIHKKWLTQKLKNDDYFSILLDYALYITSMFWTYREISHRDIRILDKKIRALDTSGLSRVFISDIQYIEEYVKDMLRMKK